MSEEIKVAKSEEKITYKKIMNSKWTVGIFVLIAIVIGFFYISNMLSGEYQAKKTVENYMDALKNGDNDREYIDTFTEGFIDVFDYEYLKILEAPKVKDTYRVTYERWKEFYDTGSESFAEYRESEIELFEGYEVIQNSSSVLELWDGESYEDIHKFLYNVEIANGLGQKVYKKAEFTVEYNTAFEKYEITDIYIR